MLDSRLSERLTRSLEKLSRTLDNDGRVCYNTRIRHKGESTSITEADPKHSQGKTMSIKRSKPYMDDYLPEQDDPNDVPHYREEHNEEQNDGANGYDDDVIELELADDSDIEEDDGQPSELSLIHI
mgnify:FL=1